MRQNQSTDIRVAGELAFEPPPRFGGCGERRASARAEMIWAELQRDEATSLLCGDAGGQSSLDALGAYRVVLDLNDDGAMTVVEVGDDVAAAFVLGLGSLGDEHAGDGPDGLATRLSQVCAGMRTRVAAMSFEGVIAGAGGDRALLTRAVVLPRTDRAGGLVGALAILSWMEILSVVASDALRRELNLSVAQRQFQAPDGRSFVAPSRAVRH